MFGAAHQHPKPDPSCEQVGIFAIFAGCLLAWKPCNRKWNNKFKKVENFGTKYNQKKKEKKKLNNRKLMTSFPLRLLRCCVMA